MKLKLSASQIIAPLPAVETKPPRKHSRSLSDTYLSPSPSLKKFIDDIPQSPKVEQSTIVDNVHIPAVDVKTEDELHISNISLDIFSDQPVAVVNDAPATNAPPPPPPPPPAPKNKWYANRVVSAPSSSGLSSSSSSKPTKPLGACPVCMEDITSNKTVGLFSCSHVYCGDCVSEHLRVLIYNGKARKLKCMFPGCPYLVAAHRV